MQTVVIKIVLAAALAILAFGAVAQTEKLEKDLDYLLKTSRQAKFDRVAVYLDKVEETANRHKEPALAKSMVELTKAELYYNECKIGEAQQAMLDSRYQLGLARNVNMARQLTHLSKIVFFLTKTGDIVNSGLFLSDIEKNIESYNNEPVYLQYAAAKVQYLLKIGYYQQASIFAQKTTELGNNLVKQAQTTLNSKVSKKTKREANTIATESLNLLTKISALACVAEAKRGDYSAADKHLTAAKGFAGKGANKNIDIAIAAARLAAYRSDKDFASKYRTALKILGKTYNSKTTEFMDLLEEKMDAELDEGTKSNYFNTYKKLDETLTKLKEKPEFHQARQSYIKARSQTAEGYYSSLDQEIKSLKLYINSPRIPSEWKIKILEFLMRLEVSRNDDHTAKLYLTQLQTLGQTTYPNDCPEIGRQKMIEAEFITEFEDKFADANELYKTWWFGSLAKQLKPTQRIYFQYLNAYGRLCELTDRFADAKQSYNQALDIIKTKFGEQDYRYAGQLFYLGRLHNAEAQYRKAEDFLIKAQKITEDQLGKSNFQNILILKELGGVYLNMGLYQQAEDYLFKADKIASENKQRYGLVDKVDLAQLYYLQGYYYDAVGLVDDILINTTVSNRLARRENLHPLKLKAEISLTLGEYPTADRYIRRALELSRELFGDSSLNTINIRLVQAKIQSALGDYDRSEQILSEVNNFVIKKLGEQHLLSAQCLTQSAINGYLIDKNKEKTTYNLTKASVIISQAVGNRHPLYAEALRNLAFINIEKNDLQKAAELLQQSNEIWIEKQGRRNANLAENLVLLGDIDTKYKKYAEAEKKYKAASQLYLKIFNNMHPRTVSVESRRAKIAYLQGKMNKAIKMLDFTTNTNLEFLQKFLPSLSDREKAKYWSIIKPDFDLFFAVAMQAGEKQPRLLEKVFDIQLATKAILLNTSLNIKEKIFNSDDKTLIADYREWLALKEKLLNQGSTANTSTSAQPSKQEIETRIEALEKKLSERSELFGTTNNMAKSYSWNDLRKTLTPNEVVVEIIRINNITPDGADSVTYYALVVTPKTKRNPKAIRIASGTEIETKFLNYYRNAMKFRREDKISYKTFWEKLEPHIADRSTVYFSGEGVYNQINLETLMRPEGDYLLDHYTFVMLNSSRELLQREQTQTKKRNNSKTALLIGNPKFNTETTTDRDFWVTNLPEAEKEVEWVEKYLKNRNWNTSRFTGVTALESVVKQPESISLIHMATHGFFKEDKDEKNFGINTLNEARQAENPLLRCGLLMTGGGDLIRDGGNLNQRDGVLTAYEAANLNLTNTELVILSACETGLGDYQVGEGVYGLQRAFFLAGAQNIIMSLFKVSDQSTRELMTAFYNNWDKTGDKRNAFVLAKKEIRQKYPNPVDWGAFIMLGL